MKRLPGLKHRPLLAALVCVIVANYGCSLDEPTAPAPLLRGLALPARGVTAGAQEVIGDIGPGSKYGIWIPENWNGELVLYAHGFIDSEVPIALPTGDNIEALRDSFLGLGFAVAYSSYSENGLAVKEGTQRTQQLRAIFVSKFGHPERIYLVGHSLGGAVAMALTEKHPQHYDGALTIGGMIGGSQPEIDYIANVRILFDFCYPGVLPGSVCDIPDGIDLNNDVVFPVIGAITADPTHAGMIAFIEQTPVPYRTPEELVESLVRALGFNFRGFADVTRRTHGHCPVDNAVTVYTGPLPPSVLAAINGGVQRYSSTPDAGMYLQHYFEPSGDLEIPVLTLHNRYDPVVPIFHEGIFQQAVAAAGKSSLLVQRTIEDYGHPGTDVAIITQAFQDLVTWVETGVTPAP
jgi:pimeloyl-ACP methyl ester carboxylesterase